MAFYLTEYSSNIMTGLEKENSIWQPLLLLQRKLHHKKKTIPEHSRNTSWSAQSILRLAHVLFNLLSSLVCESMLKFPYRAPAEQASASF